MIENKYINEESNSITNMIEEFVVLSKQIGIKTTEDAENVCRWYSLKYNLEKLGLIN